MFWVQLAKLVDAFFGHVIAAERPAGSHWYAYNAVTLEDLVYSVQMLGIGWVDEGVKVFRHGVSNFFKEI